jgi:hypothetical protein
MREQNAYSDLYIEDAMCNMANLVDYVVNDLHRDADEFFQLFNASGIAREFGHGNPKYVSGMSGQELVLETYFVMGLREELPEQVFRAKHTPEHWYGRMLAYAQWKTSAEFCDILKYRPCANLADYYVTYHDKTDDRFVEQLCIEMQQVDTRETNLAFYRRMRAYSQRLLSEKSGVSLRAIQQYEQRQKSINKAAAESVLALSESLGCTPEDLME